jgi:hypothetical protein
VICDLFHAHGRTDFPSTTSVHARTTTIVLITFITVDLFRVLISSFVRTFSILNLSLVCRDVMMS